ncbi:MAG: helix-turn-helix transcriptional regulator [Bacillota bacterium]
MSKTDIIERISFFRTRAKLSQKALSIAIDMNIGYINRLESKKDFLPSLESLLKIIAVCSCTEEEFFYRDISKYPNDKIIIDKIQTLPQDKRDAILKLI